ncbi:prolyl oligopeptidase family serine peptidase [Undibacterium sp. TJN19]|uniref:prolyl oligopeptidase family serine peptidase n=1 Tax=Undibacterium sp. TJN19 TaxID=3413055 RepID=UPI003BF3F1A1
MTIEATLDVLARLRFASNLCFARDGAAVFATIRNASSEAGSPNPSHIWRFDATGARQLTDGPQTALLVRPSPCDDRLAFASDRDCPGKFALFLLAASGEVIGIGQIPGTIEDLRWSADGDFIVVLSADRGLNGGATRAATRIWWGDAQEPEITRGDAVRRRLFRVMLACGTTEEVGPCAHSVWEFDLVPGGAVAIASRDASERGWHHAQLLQIDFADRATTVLHTPAWQLQGLATCPDGSKLAFVEAWASDRGLVAGDLSLLDLVTGRVSVHGRERQSNLNSIQWLDNSKLLFAGWDRLGTIFGVMSVDGEIAWQQRENATLAENGYTARVIASLDGKTIATVHESTGMPPEICWKQLHEPEWTRISNLNPHTVSLLPDYPEVRHITWCGKDGLALEALVLLPRNRGSSPLPMIVDIHGGPSYANKYSFNTGNALPYVSAGFAVFLPNYRGNTGWGQKFARMNLGDPAGAEFDDIQAGIDHCIALGLADAGRLGVTGSSYGGYLTNWAVATTQRFKAAVSVSSISSHISCHYGCEHDFHAFINGGPLMEEANMHIATERSPLMQMHAHDPVTPTLFIHGRDDRCTPPSEAQQFYAALRERGVNTELAIYPREGHGSFRERAHRIDSWLRRIDWFRKYMKSDEVTA